MWIESILGSLFTSAFGTLLRVCVRVFLQHCHASFMLKIQSCKVCAKLTKTFYLVTCAWAEFFLFWSFFGRTYMFYNWAIITSDAIFRFRFGFGFWLRILSKARAASAATTTFITTVEKRSKVIHINEDLNKGARNEKARENANECNMLWQ